MMDEPTIRVVVEKNRLFTEVHQLGEILKEYQDYLLNEPEGENWDPKTLDLIRSHSHRLEQSKISLRTIDMATALLRQVMKKLDAENISFQMNEDDLHFQPKKEQPPEELKHIYEDLVAQLNTLAASAPLSMQEKIRILLLTFLNLFKMLIEGNNKGVEDVMLQINLLTSSRESQNLVREIALIARDIYNTLNTLSDGLPFDSLSESTEGISEAAGKLKDVISKLENAAMTNLEMMESLNRRVFDHDTIYDRVLTNLRLTQQTLGEIKFDHPEFENVLSGIQDKISNQVGSGIMTMKNRVSSEAETFMELISSQSFQDLTGQTLKKTIVFIENLELQLVSLLKKYRPILSPGEVAEGIASHPAVVDQKQTQDEVDNLLADLGF